MQHVRIENLRKRAIEAVMAQQGYWMLFFPELEAIDAKFATRHFTKALDYLGKKVFVRGASTPLGNLFTGEIIVRALERSAHLDQALFVLHGKHPRTPSDRAGAQGAVVLHVTKRTSLAYCHPVRRLR